MKHPKHTARGQWAEFGERRFYARSRAELRYAAVLEMQRKAGLIDDWRHEPKRFVFPDRTRAPLFYLPDFEVTKNDGATHLVEVKGHWESKDREKIRLMARHYPEVRIEIVWRPKRAEDVIAFDVFMRRVEEARRVGREEAAKVERTNKRRSA